MMRLLADVILTLLFVLFTLGTLRQAFATGAAWTGPVRVVVVLFVLIVGACINGALLYGIWFLTGSPRWVG
jgi:hypothetical protein